jgi:PDZ domain-containing protein
MKRATKTVAFVLALSFIVAGGWVRLPYFAVAPGPAREVEPLITVSGHATYPSAGKLYMTTVSFYPVTTFQAIQVWLDPNLSLVAREVLYPPGQSVQQVQRQGISQMDQSKIDATYVVLKQLADYPAKHGEGALVEGVISGCPADGHLYSGDVITAINGKPVHTSSSALDMLGALPPLTKITFHISAANQQQDISLVRRPCAGSAKPLVGIYTVDQFPYSIQISSGDIGGPSAGLMYALGLYDLLTPGDLTGGRTIAGTGTLDLAGTVGPIGGIRDKVVAAERVGATLFLAPKDNMAELKGMDTGSMSVVSIGTFEDALKYLENGQAA